MIKRYLKKFPILYRGNAFLKEKLQKRKYSTELTYYQAKAARKGIVVPNEEELFQALQERLKNHGINPILKSKGELNIFLAYYVSNWEAVLPKALKSFGRVTEFEWRSKGFDDSSPDWLAQRDRMNEAMLSLFYKVHKEQPIDAVVGYLSGYNTNPLTVIKMGDSSAVIFNFCWDDKIGFRGKRAGGRWSGPAALASVVDLNLTNAPDSCIKYMVEGGLAIFWPEAADPDVHKLYDLPFEYDISFVGQCYGWRPKIINNLKKAGINIVTFGPGWKNGSLSDEEMIKLYSRSRINLGFAGIGYSKKLMCLKGRDFEVPMSGGLYLTQDNPELSLVYDVGKEIVTYQDEGDCAEKIRFLLNHPDEAAKIREAGHIKALKDHTWHKRFEQIFRIVGLL